MAKVKCPICNKMNEREDVVNYKKGNRYYCKECYQKMLNGVNLEKTDYNLLYDYILDLYGKKPTNQMFKQIQRYVKQGMTYYGIEMSLKYFHEYMENPVDPDAGIGIVDWIYDEANEYFNNLSDIMEYNDKIDISDEVKTVRPNSDRTRILMRRKIITNNDSNNDNDNDNIE